MKKILSFVLLGLFVTVAVGCSGSSTSSNKPAAPAPK